jgi:hypothetical protein
MADLSSFFGVTLLAGAFPLAEWRRRTATFKSRWAALSAGVAVAYMFVNVLPELAEHQPTVAASAAGTLLSAEKRIYVWALAGFVTFVGLRKWRFQRPRNQAGAEDSGSFFWAQMSGFAIYVLLIGYLLVHREDTSLASLWLFAAAMGLHLFMLDFELVEQFPRLYDPRGRAILTAAVFLGWALGSMNAFPETFTSRLFAFILGGVTINSAHEELGTGGSAHFRWFIAGAAAYAAILLLV